MDPREQLRRYLEHRREMGDRELILDGMSVEDVMRILGAGVGASDPAAPASPRVSVQRPALPAEPREREDDSLATADWRDVLRAAGGEPRRATAVSRPTADLESAEREPPPPNDLDAPEPAAPIAPAPVSVPPTSARPVPQSSDGPPGIVVGTSSRELFGGAL